LEVLEDRITPASPGILAGLLNPGLTVLQDNSVSAVYDSTGAVHSSTTPLGVGDIITGVLRITQSNAGSATTLAANQQLSILFSAQVSSETSDGRADGTTLFGLSAISPSAGTGKSLDELLTGGTSQFTTGTFSSNTTFAVLESQPNTTNPTAQTLADDLTAFKSASLYTLDVTGGLVAATDFFEVTLKNLGEVNGPTPNDLLGTGTHGYLNGTANLGSESGGFSVILNPARVPILAGGVAATHEDGITSAPADVAFTASLVRDDAQTFAHSWVVQDNTFLALNSDLVVPASTISVTPDVATDPTGNAVSNSRDLHLTGTADEDSQVTVTVTPPQGPVTTLPATLQGTSWSLDYPAPSDGLYSFTATETSGDDVRPAGALDVVVQTTESLTVASLNNPTTGGIIAGSATNVSNPSLSGTADPGSTVTVTVSGTTAQQTPFSETVGTTTAQADGSWSVGFAPGDALPDGNYTFTATSTDLAGNTASGNVGITVDTEPPSVKLPLTTITTGVGTPINISGSITDTGVNETFTAQVDYIGNKPGSNPTSQPLTLNPDGTFTLDHTYSAQGIYVVTVSATDSAGNVGSASFTVVVLGADKFNKVEKSQQVTTPAGASATVMVADPTQSTTVWFEYDNTSGAPDVGYVAVYQQTDNNTLTIDAKLLNANVSNLKLTIASPLLQGNYDIEYTDPTTGQMVSLRNNPNVSLSFDPVRGGVVITFLNVGPGGIDLTGTVFTVSLPSSSSVTTTATIQPATAAAAPAPAPASDAGSGTAAAVTFTSNTQLAVTQTALQDTQLAVGAAAQGSQANTTSNVVPTPAASATGNGGGDTASSGDANAGIWRWWEDEEFWMLHGIGTEAEPVGFVFPNSLPPVVSGATPEVIASVAAAVTMSKVSDPATPLAPPAENEARPEAPQQQEGAALVVLAAIAPAVQAVPRIRRSSRSRPAQRTRGEKGPHLTPEPTPRKTGSLRDSPARQESRFAVGRLLGSMTLVGFATMVSLLCSAGFAEKGSLPHGARAAMTAEAPVPCPEEPSPAWMRTEQPRVAGRRSSRLRGLRGTWETETGEQHPRTRTFGRLWRLLRRGRS
jgi:hypothetical protein